jgi:glucosamine kinase
MNALADVLLLGIDGGGSRCRARLCNIAGATLSEGVAGAATLRLGVEQSFASVLQATMQCMNGAGLSSRDFERVVACVALAGASEPSQLEAARRHDRCPGGMRRGTWRA